MCSPEVLWILSAAKPIKIISKDVICLPTYNNLCYKLEINVKLEMFDDQEINGLDIETEIVCIDLKVLF